MPVTQGALARQESQKLKRVQSALVFREPGQPLGVRKAQRHSRGALCVDKRRELFLVHS